MSDICDISNEELNKGIWDTNFTDIEDSYQYQNAIAEQCEYLITLNKKDFHPRNEQIEIVTPDEFIKEYPPDFNIIPSAPYKSRCHPRYPFEDAVEMHRRFESACRADLRDIHHTTIQ